MNSISHNFPLYARKEGNYCKYRSSCSPVHARSLLSLATRSGASGGAGGWSVTQAPAVEFVTKRSFGRTVERAAHDRTGRDADTGNVRLAIAIRCRNNGMVRFDGDLLRLPYDLSPDAILLLCAYWDLLNQATPKNVYARMNRHFSRNTIIFDAMAEQADDWRNFLKTVLSGMTSYLGID